jgi:hypothetical protein
MSIISAKLLTHLRFGAIRGASRRREPTPVDWVARFFWILVVLTHLPAWIKNVWLCGAAGVSLDALSSLAILSPVLLLAGLKLVRVSWLEFNWSRESWLAAMLVVALLHVHCATRYLPAPAIPAEASSTLVVSTFISLLPLVGCCLASLTLQAQRRPLWFWWLAPLHAPRLRPIARAWIPRGPPRRR